MVGEVYKICEEKMGKALEVLRNEFAGIRTGRATTQLLDGIKVECYGSTFPLKELATLGVPQPRLLVVQPYDKTILPDIEKSILNSQLGLTPVNDGKVIKLPIPQLTEERRKDLAKLSHKLAEDVRVAIRNVRRDSNEKVKSLEKDGDISEDDRETSLKKIQEITDRYIEKVDELVSRKEKEIMEV
ncbi:ribosome recycling factor [candidate division TA06 bacterium DG_26]|uniref:Ribosome-recycling factor n=1 Tax=candidate division TA06 bacterium DG_26 TaxID=1703771 RepID=A0A0S7WLZ8_UNCT6|nr:MAG: ribosome recycling factor [candidate division TA06 bacterium DG_26]